MSRKLATIVRLQILMLVMVLFGCRGKPLISRHLSIASRRDTASEVDQAAESRQAETQQFADLVSYRTSSGIDEQQVLSREQTPTVPQHPSLSYLSGSRFDSNQSATEVLPNPEPFQTGALIANGATGLLEETNAIENPNVDSRYIASEASLRLSFGRDDVQLREITLAEAIAIALSDTKTLRTLNATVVTNPQLIASSFDPAITRSNPAIGYDAALSAFDSRLSASALYSKNDDVFNNPVLGSGANEIRDDVTLVETGLNKIGQYGTQYSLGSSIQNSSSNNPSLLFQDSWTTVFEGTIRQPLLQGRGKVNQILGPNAQPGLTNNRGILLALSDAQVSKAQFQIALRDMAREVAGSYWELNLAYSRLQASSQVRSLAYSTWQATKARFDQGLAGGSADEEALARAQYFRISAQVNADLQGNRQAGQTGVLQAEADLRRLLGMEQSAEILYPTDSPLTAPIRFDGALLKSQAFTKRLEARQQMTRVEQVQLELVGLKNLLLPRLDLLLTIRNNGFGDDLAGNGPRFSSAFQDAFSGDHNEAEFGMSYEIPVRFRQAKAAIRNGQLRLARERAILHEQEQQIGFELDRSLRAVYRHQLDFAYQSDRVKAAQAASDARTAAFETGIISIDDLLITQQRLLDAKRAFFDTLLSIQQSRLDVDFQSGNLLDEYCVHVIDQ